jgi:transcription elongation factor GreA
MSEDQLNENEYIITRAGYERLERELEILLERDNTEMAARMADVREEGDIGEEPAFFDAMKEKNQLEDRIARLRTVLARATIIDEDPDPETASPGDRVIAVDLDTDEELTFDLIGGYEVAHGRRGVSIRSPVGKALLNRRIGDTIEVKVPDGKVRYKITGLDEIPEDI